MRKGAYGHGELTVEGGTALIADQRSAGARLRPNSQAFSQTREEELVCLTSASGLAACYLAFSYR